MNISMEQIDEMRKRTNCSYQEAKELLEKHNGDMVEAIVEFEKKHSHGSKQTSSSDKNSSFGKKARELIQKGFQTRFVIEKDENTILNLSVNIIILAVIITLPIFWIYPVLLIVIYLMGYKIRIRKEEGEEVDINQMVDGIGSKVRTATEQMRGKPSEKGQHNRAHSEVNNNSEAKNNSEQQKEDDYNEITIK